MAVPKNDHEAIELATTDDIHETAFNTKGPVMRSKSDDLSVWQSARRFKLVSGIAMCAAFCASLDGYRNSSTPLDLNDKRLIGMYRNQSQWGDRVKQGIHPTVRYKRDGHYRREIYISVGRDSISWSNCRSNCMTLVPFT